MTRINDWLRYSEELLDITKLLIDKGKYSWSCFTSHQAATAALKAILAKDDQPTLGDNLIALLRLAKKENEIPSKVETACHNINEHFKSSRDLEKKPEGTPLDNYSLDDSTRARTNALLILRHAHHLAAENGNSS